MKLEQKIKAQELRNQGLTIKNISKQLNVSKSSVSLWVRDIKLTEKQMYNLQQQNPAFNKQLNGSQIRSDNARLKRLQWQKEGKLKAKEGDLLHQAGCMLFWAEGKKHKNTCSFTNSDINMVKLFIKFMRTCFNVSNDKLTLTINCYTNNNLSKEDIENFWINELQLNKSNLRKGQENLRPRSATNKIRHNKLLYGIICLSLHSTEITQHIYGAIQEYANFNNNYMLM